MYIWRRTRGGCDLQSEEGTAADLSNMMITIEHL